MARPTKQGIDYFPLDVDFDDKIELLIADKGGIALAVIITIWQLIFKNHGYYIENNDDLPLLIKRRLMVEQNIIIDIINSSLYRGIFNKKINNDFMVLTSAGIQKRYIVASRLKKEIKLVKNYLCIDISNVGNAICIDENNEINATNVNVNVNEEVDVDNNTTKATEIISEEKQKKKRKKKEILPEEVYREKVIKIFSNGFFADIKPLWKETYSHVDIEYQLNKMKAWCLTHLDDQKVDFRKFANGWLSREDSKIVASLPKTNEEQKLSYSVMDD